MNAHHPTQGDVARDRITFAVASAYARLLGPTRTDLVAFLAGPRNPVEAHRVAEVIVASTSDADLVPLLARLLMAADAEESVEAAAYGRGAVSGAGCTNTGHPLRRSYDKAEG
ncbi:MAG: hypothetical protein DI537_44355 [Stutzerimonas stutzeri]|nr:MAG: hypothetical protein DI537_44355 [Stutzerimonas stutzeri]